jgi:predicted Zn-dependent protease
LAGFGEFTIRDEIELARKFDLIIETRFPVIDDTRITGYVQSVVDRIVAAMPPQPFPIKVTVVRNPALNAFCLGCVPHHDFTAHRQPGRGDELASVIAHECHVSCAHRKSIDYRAIWSGGSLWACGRPCWRAPRAAATARA